MPHRSSSFDDSRPAGSALPTRRCRKLFTTSKPSFARLSSHNVRWPAYDDVMLLSYLVNPTHGSHTLPDIAARTTSRALIHQPTKDNPSDPKRLPEAAAYRLALPRRLARQIS